MKLIPIVAMVCIAGLEALAMFRGIDGALFGIVIAALAGLGGYEIKVIREKRRGGEKW